MPEYRISWKAARVNAGLTLKDVAHATGRCIDTIMRYEKDSSNIPLDLMNVLLELYGVPAAMIYCGKESDLIGKLKRKTA